MLIKAAICLTILRMGEMEKVKVWDWPVRVCHWLLAACVLANLAITEDGSDVHRYVGYTAAGIVVFRLIWGGIGSRYARFSDFWPTPTKLKAHVNMLLQGKHDEHLGHNPFGALMAFTLWACVLGLGISGWMMGTDRFWGEDWVENLHEVIADGMMILVSLHVLAVFVMSWYENQNLVGAMITGNKTVTSVDETQNNVVSVAETRADGEAIAETQNNIVSVAEKQDEVAPVVDTEDEASDENKK